ncbi:MAG: hypothetical protein H0W34_10575, partial [Pyrinomonadaceae bacterium]|nr:hypothetical protein [Pyrinomonadaceae bacterium]
MITREQLGRISEDRLRKEILIPLFAQMGYGDVFEYHGGPLEQGKDIVMWKSGELRDRLNYSVVVKTKVNGRASGAGSAGEVVAQIQQCFASPYRDPLTGEERRVDRCLVVVANRITKEFLNVVGPGLEAARLARVTEFVDANRLWDWIKSHQPEKTTSIFAPFEELQTLLSEQCPGLGADIQISEEKMTFSLKPIEPGATLPPQSIVLEFSLEGEQGKKLREEYERCLKTGASFHFLKEQVKSIEVSDLLKKIYGLTPDRAVSFSFTPNPSSPVIWHFIRVCDNGYTAALPG